MAKRTKLAPMPPAGMTRADVVGPQLAPEEIVPTKGKTEVYVGGRLVGEIKGDDRQHALGTEAMMNVAPTQEEINAEREHAESVSKAIAAAARKSKKEVAKMAK